MSSIKFKPQIGTYRIEDTITLTTSTETLLDLEQLLESTIELADDIATRPNRGNIALPLNDLHELAKIGLLRAPLPADHGGLGLGCQAGRHSALLHLLSTLGGADLALGRIYEGHVNAIILISAFGTSDQLEQAAQNCQNGQWFGVWNTGRPEVLRLLEKKPSNSSFKYVFHGSKTFATGAAFIQCPVVTAHTEGGWQMTLPRMDSLEVARAISIDRSSWHPLGMAATESFDIDFTGANIAVEDLIGRPGDFYRDPLFYGGSIRFAAVHTGALLRLHRHFAQWLDESRSGPNPRHEDPYQVARLGEIAIGAQEAVLWIERAAEVADECLFTHASKLEIERIHETADMTRLAVERIATAMMARIVAGVGAHGLLQPSPFERIVRDLTMYLRQPIADHTLAAVGRASLRKSSLRAQGAGNGFWSDTKRQDSLPPTYFERLYERAPDPWFFETSAYEKQKYATTLSALGGRRYANTLEIGCSIGILTYQLASVTECLLAIDVSDVALAAAHTRCKSLPGVRFARMQIPYDEPSGLFDLVVLSEVAYYWEQTDLERAIRMIASLQPYGSHLLLVHHTTPVDDYPLTGDEVHESVLSSDEWAVIHQERHEGYRLDLLVRCRQQLSRPDYGEQA